MNSNSLNEEPKVLTSKQPQATPRLTPASTPPCWQVVWFFLAAICACLHSQKKQQTEEQAHEVQHVTDNYIYIVCTLDSENKFRCFNWQRWQHHLHILALVRSQ